MSKATVTRLFAGAVLATVTGVIAGAIAVVSAIADGVISLGGPSLVTVDGAALAEVVGWLVIASLVSGAGAIATLVAWVGALRNTAQLDDKTWFVGLLALGLCSFGWAAMVAYVIAGPDSATQGMGHGVATADAT